MKTAYFNSEDRAEGFYGLPGYSKIHKKPNESKAFYCKKSKMRKK